MKNATKILRYKKCDLGTKAQKNDLGVGAWPTI